MQDKRSQLKNRLFYPLDWEKTRFLFILINGILNYDMADDYKKLPSWKNEVNLWIQSDEKKPIALWPQGWYVELQKKKTLEYRPCPP